MYLLVKIYPHLCHVNFARDNLGVGEEMVCINQLAAVPSLKIVHENNESDRSRQVTTPKLDTLSKSVYLFFCFECNDEARNMTALNLRPIVAVLERASIKSIPPFENERFAHESAPTTQGKSQTRLKIRRMRGSLKTREKNACTANRTTVTF